MAKEQRQASQNQGLSNFLGDRPSDWQAQVEAIALRFNKEYRGEAFDVPPEVAEMPIYQERKAGILAAKLATSFWEVAQPKKNQRCLDIGCGVSFLIYPWRDWEALFYGQDISVVVRDLLTARGPQLNSKLFKGIQLGAAHELKYEANQFDLAIATGFSCYYPIDYWAMVIAEAKRVLKPDGIFVFDVLNPDASLAEDWAVLETYFGAEVFLESLENWQKLIKSAGGQVMKTQPGELFQLYKVRFS